MITSDGMDIKVAGPQYPGDIRSLPPEMDIRVAGPQYPDDTRSLPPKQDIRVAGPQYPDDTRNLPPRQDIRVAGPQYPGDTRSLPPEQDIRVARSKRAISLAQWNKADGEQKRKWIRQGRRIPSEVLNNESARRQILRRVIGPQYSGAHFRDIQPRPTMARVPKASRDIYSRGGTLSRSAGGRRVSRRGVIR